MREIKFRAWDSEFELMLKPNTLHEWCVAALEAGNCNMDNYTVMQYTGLKDKNGVDIYEGDIVSCVSSHYDEHGNHSIKSHKYVEVFITSVYGVVFGSVPYRKCGNIKVIGNIHQTPELLKC